MNARELIAELERFDPTSQVAIATPYGARFASDVGRRDRPEHGVHPVIYLIQASADEEYVA